MFHGRLLNFQKHFIMCEASQHFHFNVMNRNSFFCRNNAIQFFFVGIYHGTYAVVEGYQSIIKGLYFKSNIDIEERPLLHLFIALSFS